MRKSAFWTLSLLVLAGLVIAACGGAPTATQAVVEEATEAVVEEPTEEVVAEPVTIRWFVGLGTGTSESQLETQHKVVEDFNASHPNIVLEIEIAPSFDVGRDTLKTEIAAGNAPDIVGPVGVGGSNDFTGAWLDLGPLVEQTG